MSLVQILLGQAYAHRQEGFGVRPGPLVPQLGVVGEVPLVEDMGSWNEPRGVRMAIGGTGLGEGDTGNVPREKAGGAEREEPHRRSVDAARKVAIGSLHI